MNEKQTGGAPQGLTVGDVWFVLFRHKWKIVILTLLGAIAAGVVPFRMPRVYESEAKLFVKYVVETKSPAQIGASAGVNNVDEGEAAINTEIEILTSLDLAKKVAEVLTNANQSILEKLLAKSGGGSNVMDASMVIRDGLILDVPKHGKVIVVSFRHSESDVVQPVLREVIAAYKTKHEATHRPTSGLATDLQGQLEVLKSRLNDTELRLRAAKTNVGVVSLEESKKLYYEQMSRIRQSISDAEADLAGRKAALNEFASILNVQPAGATNGAARTNEIAVPTPTVAEYRRLSLAQEMLKNREQELLFQYTTNNAQVKAVQEQLGANEKLKKRLEEQYPALVTMKALEPRTSADPNVSLRTQMLAETAQITANESRIKKLKEQLEEVGKAASGIEAVENQITQLEREKKLDEENYMRLAMSVDQVKLDSALNRGGDVYNLTTIQEPSPAIRVASKMYKMMAMIFFGCMAAAIGLAFFIEFYLDQSIKRPVEVEAKIGVPLFLSIPKLQLNGKGRPKVPLLPAGNGAGAGAAVPLGEPEGPGAGQELAPWHPMHQLRPFYEALRERLITFFEIKNYTHKPKLVAITSCAEGAGVSTVAAGLAASLSETGDGNVLLVDMNLQNGAAHQFYRGDLACGLDDALELERRGNAMVQDNLYVVSENTKKEKLSNVLPQRFKNLVPRLKTSDYDYIIFDMPPVSQISMTPRLARFMDAVLIVVESEKTDREVVKRASALLAESKTNVGIVLNKGCNPLPKRLQQEL